MRRGRHRHPSIRTSGSELWLASFSVARVLRLTLLVPDTVETVLAGTEPAGLSLEELCRVPAVWEEQRQALAQYGIGPGGSGEGRSGRCQPHHPSADLPLSGRWLEWPGTALLPAPRTTCLPLPMPGSMHRPSGPICRLC